MDKNNWEDSDYQALVDESEKRLFRPEDALCIFASESGLAANRPTQGKQALPGSGPFAFNPKFGGAKGLFQALPLALKTIGYIPGDTVYEQSKGDFREVPIVEQIACFGRYLDFWRRTYFISSWDSAGDMYIANFYPSALKHRKDPAFHIVDNPSLNYVANKGLDHGGKGFVTIEDMRIQAEKGRLTSAFKVALASLTRIRGSQGLPVTLDQWKDAQRRLNQVPQGPVLAVDGIPGKETEHGIAYFQAYAGVLVTGQMNDNTYRKLLSVTV